ncbi:hypothetical protein BDZ45DRAFT_196131 [Acephala macrosclerotiorum]|nr:hypothetical protein BDZ45DRAFT_196131 [Acephala macrosclerotiorum]
MRSLQFLSLVSAVSAFNFLPGIFKRQQGNCTVYTIIQYPCAVETWVSSNTVLWIDACATTLNITNAPTGLTTIFTSTTTLGVTTTSEVTVVVVSLQSTAIPLTTFTPPAPAQSTPLPFIPTSQPPITTGVPHITLSNSTTPAMDPTSTTEYALPGTASIIPTSAAACAPSSTVYPE